MAKRDNEYKRCGTANVFCAVEPKAGRHFTLPTPNRCAPEFATDRGYPNAPLELEIYTGGWGVLRTEYGWYPVDEVHVILTLSFELDSSHEVKPNALDQRIVRAAQSFLVIRLGTALITANFAAQYPVCMCPLSTLRAQPHD
jgi:hypothetical protein